MNEYDRAGNFSRLPLLRRARDYHVYDVKGRRYVDLYRDNGSALFGYSPPGLKQAQKDALSQAPFTGFDHIAHRQLLSGLDRAFPGHYLFVGPSAGALTMVLMETFRFPFETEDLGVIPARNDLLQPVSGSFLLPFAGNLVGDFFRLRLPAPGSRVIAVLGVAKDIVHKGLLENLPFSVDRSISPESRAYIENLRRRLCSQHSPAESRAALRGIEMLRVFDAFVASAGSNTPVLAEENLTLRGTVHGDSARKRDLQIALGDWDPVFWKTVPAGVWQTRGPYLLHPFDREQYGVVFEEALKAGILLNPDFEGLSILPGFMSKGELDSLERILTVRPGKSP